MISVNEAFSVLDNTHFSLNEIEVTIENARNLVLSETIFSPINMPPFRQSNMDGYALCLHESSTYKIIGEVKAGDFFSETLQKGQALKIFTGAAVPDSAQAVIQIEKVSVNKNLLQLQENVSHETNIRPLGSQILQNEIAIKKNVLLNAAAIGFLAGLGFTKVKVYQKPKIGIVITGNELIRSGQPLLKGKVYESNAIMLQSALELAHYNEIQIYQVDDTFEATKSVLEKALNQNDVVLVSGGISVGDYDFVKKALQSLNVETLFYKVNQKPGKPLFAGKLNNKIIFALPGNPAASLTCFYIYVLPTIKKMSGINSSYISKNFKELSHDYSINNTRDQFLKATIKENEITILPHQDSSMLDSFAMANALVFLPNGSYKLIKGNQVIVYFI